MRKVMAMVLMTSVVLGVSGCFPNGSGNIPNHAGKPSYNGDLPDQRPKGISANWPGIRVHFYGHDYQDFDTPIMFSFNILAVAANPKLFGGFVEPDTGHEWLFRDPATKANLLVTPGPKITPYGFTIWFPPGEVIEITIAYSFSGYWGDVIGCEFQMADGTNITDSRTYAKVSDISLKRSGKKGQASSACRYTTSSGGPV